MISNVYFIAAGDPPQAVKIGYASGVYQRCGEIQTGNHGPLSGAATYDGKPDNAALLRLLARAREVAA